MKPSIEANEIIDGFFAGLTERLPAFLVTATERVQGRLRPWTATIIAETRLEATLMAYDLMSGLRRHGRRFQYGFDVSTPMQRGDWMISTVESGQTACEWIV